VLDERWIDPREFDGDAFRVNPFPMYRRLREYHPVYKDLFHNRWAVSRYEDIVNIFQDNERFDRAVYKVDGKYEFGTESIFGPNILEYGNSDKHRWIRNIVADQFVGNRLQAFLPMIERVTREVVDRAALKATADLVGEFASEGRVELVSQFTTQIPIRVISRILDLPREDEETFVGWYQALIKGLGFGGEYLLAGVAARNELWIYMDPLVKQRRINPGEDLISRIVSAELDGKSMSDDEVKGFICLLLAAGGDTTDKAIANMWFHMLVTRPDQFEDVKRDPDLWDRVFTEMMRYDPVVHTQGRHTTCEVELHGKVIPERATVTLYLGAGNRDDRVFKDPDTFDIYRDDLHFGRELRSGRYPGGKAGHLGFGMGQHFCMGYAMARQEAVIACKYLVEAMPNATLKHVNDEGVTSPPQGSGGFRAPTEMEIVFDA
jgi:pulcherriminic acid synthase